MELIHIANATFSSSRIKINHSLENLASKTKLTGLLKSTRSHPRRRSALAPARDQASPPVRWARIIARRRVIMLMFNGRRAVVEPAGIEPATFWLQTRRSPS